MPGHTSSDESVVGGMLRAGIVGGAGDHLRSARIRFVDVGVIGNGCQRNVLWPNFPIARSPACHFRLLGASSCTITASRITASRCDIDSASIWSYVTNTVVTPRLCCGHLSPERIVRARAVARGSMRVSLSFFRGRRRVLERTPLFRCRPGRLAG